MNSAQTPVEIDTKLADLYGRRAQAQRNRDSAARTLANPKASTYSRSVAEEQLAKRDAEIVALAEEIAPLNAQYQARRWSRFFLVANANGHVHSSMHCSTCFDDTRYTWLVSLAGQTEADMVEEWGERACTVCFPSAPTLPRFSQPAKVDLEARRAAEEAKAAREADKASKALVEEIRVGYDTIKTKVAARNAFSSNIENVLHYGVDGGASRNEQSYGDRLVTLARVLTTNGIDWKPVAERKIKSVTKDLAKPVPAHLAHFTTPEQQAERAAEHKANLEALQALLSKLS